MSWINILPTELPKEKVLAESRTGHTMEGYLKFWSDARITIDDKNRPQEVICIDEADENFIHVYRYKIIE